MTYAYDFDTLHRLTSHSNPVSVGYMTTARRVGDAIHLTYRNAPLATITAIGVRPYLHDAPAISKSFKKRMNAVLKEVGWALVTRNDKTYLMFRSTTDVHVYDGTLLCLPDGQVVQVAVPDQIASVEGSSK